MEYFADCWDQLPAQVREQMESLFKIAKGAAEKKLEKRNSFTPFGLMITKDFDVLFANTNNKALPAQDAFDEIIHSLMDTKDSYCMAAMVAAVEIKGRADYSDGLLIELHHDFGTAARIILPYKKRGFLKKKLYFAEMERLSFDGLFLWQPVGTEVRK